MKLQNTTILTFVIALFAVVFVNASANVSEETNVAPPSGEGTASSSSSAAADVTADNTPTPETSKKKRSVFHFFQKKVIGRISGTYPPATPQNSKESDDGNTETIADEVVKHESEIVESA